MNDLAAIQALLTERPDLAQRLQGVTTRRETARRLTAIADEHGISADADEIEREMERRVQGAADNGELSDEQLEAVAGGNAALLSSITLGIGCALASAIAAGYDQNCRKALG